MSVSKDEYGHDKLDVRDLITGLFCWLYVRATGFFFGRLGDARNVLRRREEENEEVSSIFPY